MLESNDKLGFIQAQYNQYWEMKRFHLNLSWNIPTLAVAAAVAFIAYGPEKITKWVQRPTLPAAALLATGLFVLLVFLHNHRNLVFAGVYEEAIIELEEEYGVAKKVHHRQMKGRIRGLAGISSSTFLGVFLLTLAVALLVASAHLWYVALK
jgi:hypothetical protein